MRHKHLFPFFQAVFQARIWQERSQVFDSPFNRRMFRSCVVRARKLHRLIRKDGNAVIRSRLVAGAYFVI